MPRFALFVYAALYYRGRSLNSLQIAESASVGFGTNENGTKMYEGWRDAGQLGELNSAGEKSGGDLMDVGFDGIQVKEITR